MADHRSSETASFSAEVVNDGDKGQARWRSDKRVKRYLTEKRPHKLDNRLYSYRTSTCVALNEAVADVAPADLIAFLEIEYRWAVEKLREIDPEALARLQSDVFEGEERDFTIMLEAMRWKNNRWVAARGIFIDVRGKNL